MGTYYYGIDWWVRDNFFLLTAMLQEQPTYSDGGKEEHEMLLDWPTNRDGEERSQLQLQLHLQ